MPEMALRGSKSVQVPLLRRRRVRRDAGWITSSWSGESVVAESVIAEAAARTGIPARRVRVALEFARHLGDAELAIVEKLARIARSGMPPRGRDALAHGVARALDTFTAERASDPLAKVDAPMTADAAVEAVLAAEIDVQLHRGAVLAESLSAADASALVGRSRQALERLRREGRVLALRAGSRWRYPRWQFEADAPGGVLPGLGEVLARLRLSPAGSAAWLTRPSEALGARPPIEALRRGERQAVVALAMEHGHMP